MSSPLKALSCYAAAFGLAAVAVLVGCDGETKHAGSRDELPAEFRGTEDANEGLYRPFVGDLNVNAIKTTAASADAETLLALADCACAPDLLQSIAERIARAKGTLPQVLMPPIREEIRSDDKLKLLLNLPTALADLLAGTFASDEKLAEKVRAGLGEKLARATPGGTSLAERVPFRFDGFPSLRGSPTPTVRIEDAAARWILIFGRSGVWRGAKPLAFDDHGWQTLETMRLLVEWKYLLGLDKRPDGGVYGGLTLDPKDQSGALAPFDPRKNDTARVISGAMTLRVEGGTALELALNASEKWTHKGTPISLGEQALVWRAGAQAFNRLRPENRKPTRDLFEGSEPIFPDNAHTLPLAFLPGLETLLDGELINRETRDVHRVVGDHTSRASLLDLVRMASALGAWATELRNVSGAKLDDATRTKVEKAPESMTRAVQVAVQAILKDRVVRSDGYGMALVDGNGPVSPAVAGETLATLLSLEAELLDSPLLEEHILGLFHWYAAEVLGKARDKWTAADVLWGKVAIDRLAGAANSLGDDNLPWLKDAKRLLDQAAEGLTLKEGG